MINVVIVTYGDRWDLLKKVLGKLHKEECIEKIFIIDNDSNYDVSSKCKEYEYDRVSVVKSDFNLGSAGGFSLGISLALKEPENLILLLDDDNFPKGCAIEKLLVTYRQLAGRYGEENFAVTAYRDSQHSGLKKSFNRSLRVDRDFMGFNIFNAIKRPFLLGMAKVDRVSEEVPAEITRGNAYGGLLFSPKLIYKIGLPLEELVLYFDDIEFTSRITNKGGKIFVESRAIVEDLEYNHSSSIFKIPIIGFVFGGSDKRVYYIIRNILYIDSNIDNKCGVFYFFNKYCFLFSVILLCALSLKRNRILAIYSAIADSKSGRMGVSSKYCL